MKELVYLNGNFVQREAAKISPDDRGFIFADGVYEVIKYYDGKPFRYEDHMVRLKRSIKEVSIGFSEFDDLKNICTKLIAENDLAHQQAGVYIQITRGAHHRVHYFPEKVKPTVYAFAFELPSVQEKLEKGIKAITQEDIRWHRCDIKSVSLLPNTMLYNNAFKNGAGESILIRDGIVTEATHSSLVAVKSGKVITHPLTNLVLPGITRKVVLEICNEHNIDFEEKQFSESELFEMDELFIAGTGSEIMPVVQVNDHPVGNKKPGEITRFIQQKFFEMTWGKP